MRRIDKRTVELSDPELAARDRFLSYTDKGLPTPRAARLALSGMNVSQRSDEFIEYLSEGTCRRWGNRVLIKPEFRNPDDVP